MKSSVLIALVMVLGLFACKREAPPPVIEGRIINNFGQPVPNAAISIRDTAFRVTTNAQGVFAIRFVPGTFTLHIEAPQHTSFTRELQVAQPVNYPLGTKMLFHIPDEPPSSGLISTTNGYRSLARQTLSRTRTQGRTQGAMQNCLEYRLLDHLPTFRGSETLVVFPLGELLLYRLDGSLVVRENAPDTIAQCSTSSVGIQIAAANLAGRQFISSAQPLPPGTYCLINRTRYLSLFNIQGDRQAWCFRWEQDPQVRSGARVVRTAEEEVAQNTTAGTADNDNFDDARPDYGPLPASCPLRNGVIPCTEACYRATGNWPDPGDPAPFLESEEIQGSCYRP